MPLSSNLSGRHILVTGGSKGIGRTIVQKFLAEGANVSYCARAVRGDEFSQFEGAINNARAVGSNVDISKSFEIDEWVKKAAEEFGRIDCVVANASPLIHGPDADSWNQSFQADIMGLLALIKATTPYLQERAKASENASIVVISSLAGWEARHPAIAGPYSTLKRAQATIAKDYARLLAPKGVRINTLIAGSIETQNFTLPDGTVQWSSFQVVKRDNPAFIEAVVKEIPMGRTGSPEDVANSVVFLSCHLSSYICGTSLLVDGAMSMYF